MLKVFEIIDWAKGTTPARDIKKEEQGVVYNVKNFVTVLHNIVKKLGYQDVTVNIPIEITIKGYHGDFYTKESDL